MADISPERFDKGLSSELHAQWDPLFDHPARHDAFSRIWFEHTDDYRPDTSCGRCYHNLTHVRNCLREMDVCVAALQDPRAVATAIFFHDAVYDPTRGDNEERSADIAERYLRDMGEADAFIAAVRELILDTRHRAPPATSDGRYLVDIDLSILGQAPDVYDAYDRNIRREYAHVPEDAYRVGRAAVLNSFLARATIYLTDVFRDRYERAARENLARSLMRLQVGASK